MAQIEQPTRLQLLARKAKALAELADAYAADDAASAADTFAKLHELTHEAQVASYLDASRIEADTQPIPAVEAAAKIAHDFSELPTVLTSAQLAAFLPDVEVRTLQDWRYRKIGPAYTRDEDTRRVHYLRSDVIAWLKSSRHNTQ